MQHVKIRKYKKEDRQTLRDIAFDTALIGESADVFFDDREILSDYLTMYYTDYEPQSCFVAEREGKIIGYLIGAKDVNVLKKVFIVKIVPRLLIKVISRGMLLRRKNIVFAFSCLIGFLKGEFKMPDFSKDYPATLHINITKAFRNSNIGSMLIAGYLDYLTKEDVKAAHLATMSDKAASFFGKSGFNLLYQGKRSYLRHVLNKDVPVYIYGKRLRPFSIA